MSFDFDVTEVSVERYQECVRAKACAPVRPQKEPSLPVRWVTPKQATDFCAFAGGHLPTGAEWVLAAAGDEGRRFPWGSTGLVCRRAAFGLVDGPCAAQGSGPDAAGSRPDGASPEGLLDLAGNVAEWTLEPDGTFRARGGSYAATGAAELKSWASREIAGASPEVGFRCAYAPQEH
jgi:formylglycine-generating enzyme required for sulfatase activity